MVADPELVKIALPAGPEDTVGKSFEVMTDTSANLLGAYATPPTTPAVMVDSLELKLDATTTARTWTRSTPSSISSSATASLRRLCRLALHPGDHRVISGCSRQLRTAAWRSRCSRGCRATTTCSRRSRHFAVTNGCRMPGASATSWSTRSPSRACTRTSRSGGRCAKLTRNGAVTTFITAHGALWPLDAIPSGGLHQRTPEPRAAGHPAGGGFGNATSVEATYTISATWSPPRRHLDHADGLDVGEHRAREVRQHDPAAPAPQSGERQGDRPLRGDGDAHPVRHVRRQRGVPRRSPIRKPPYIPRDRG